MVIPLAEMRFLRVKLGARDLLSKNIFANEIKSSHRFFRQTFCHIDEINK